MPCCLTVVSWAACLSLFLAFFELTGIINEIDTCAAESVRTWRSYAVHCSAPPLRLHGPARPLEGRDNNIKTHIDLGNLSRFAFERSILPASVHIVELRVFITGSEEDRQLSCCLKGQIPQLSPNRRLNTRSKGSASRQSRWPKRQMICAGMRLHDSRRVLGLH